MGLFGTVSDMVNKSSDNDILNEMSASAYKDETKTELIKNIRDSDKKLTVAKKNYGNGISVKGILANVSGYHFLSRSNLVQETGKNWSDDKCIQPTNNIDPLHTSHFFHAKADGAATGCRGGFTYQVLDKNSVKQGTVSVAWENPYTGNFVSCIIVSKNKDNLQNCLDHCNKSSTSIIKGDVTITMEDGKLKELITAKIMADNQSTAYLLVGIKTDDIIKEIYGPL